jgi:tetratricopeptide (TPR) repeat protein
MRRLDEQTWEPATTSGRIALVNLEAQINGLLRFQPELSAPSAGSLRVAETVTLIDLLTLRGHFLGRIADYEWAQELAEQLVGATQHDGTALLARARTRATFHRFDHALHDLEAAEEHGLDRATLDRERAEILQAIGRYEQAIEFYADAASEAAGRRPDFAALGALAVIHAKLENVIEAEHLFTQARRQYVGTSPFLLASLDFRRGLMWHRQGELSTSRKWFEASCRRVPVYAPALGHLSEIDDAVGAHEAAITRLQPVVSSSDDPEYGATLASVLKAVGRRSEAEQWQARAAARYDELELRHPEAFADHAAYFRRSIGFQGKAGHP